MNNIGRNKTKYLEEIGCVFEKSKLDKDLTNIYTKDKHCYVGLADLGESENAVNFIYEHRLSKLESSDGEPNHTVGIGFSETEQAWYGWTHRGYGKFFVGYKVKKGSIMDKEPHKYPFVVETLEQAKQLARDMSNYLD